MLGQCGDGGRFYDVFVSGLEKTVFHTESIEDAISGGKVQPSYILLCTSSNPLLSQNYVGDFEHLLDSSQCSDGGVFIDTAGTQAVDKETMMYPDQDEETGDKVWVVNCAVEVGLSNTYYISRI